MYVDWSSFRRCLSSSCPRQLPMKKPEHTKSAMTHRWKVVERWTALWKGKEDQQIADEFEILELRTRFMLRRRQGHLACALAAWILRRLKSYAAIARTLSSDCRIQGRPRRVSS